MFLAMKTEGGFRQMLALHLNFLLTELSISRRNRFNFKWKALQAKADCYLQKENILSFNYFLVFTQPCTSRAVRRAGGGRTILAHLAPVKLIPQGFPLFVQVKLWHIAKKLAVTRGVRHTLKKKAHKLASSPDNNPTRTTMLCPPALRGECIHFFNDNLCTFRRRL